MCFDAKTSLITFTISFVCFCYLLIRGIKTENKNDIFLSILTILIGLMQLIEFFLWRNQNCNNNNNHYFSLLIIVLLFLQGTIANQVYLKLYPNDDPFFSKNDVNSVIFIYAILTCYLLYYLNTFKLCSKPSATSCRLIWDSFVKLRESKNSILYILFICFYFLMFLFIILNSKYSKNTLLTRYPLRYSFLAIMFVIASIYVVATSYFYKELYFLMKNGHLPEVFKKLFLLTGSDAFGSVWCFLCVFIGIIGILKL